jgi:hypothetical protein
MASTRQSCLPVSVMQLKSASVPSRHQCISTQAHISMPVACELEQSKGQLCGGGEPGNWSCELELSGGASDTRGEVKPVCPHLVLAPLSSTPAHFKGRQALLQPQRQQKQRVLEQSLREGTQMVPCPLGLLHNIAHSQLLDAYFGRQLPHRDAISGPQEVHWKVHNKSDCCPGVAPINVF